VIAREHRVASCLDAGLAGQVDEQRESLAADAMLAVVDVKITGVDRQLSPAGWIVLEEFSQVNAFDVGVMSARYMSA